MDGYDVTAYEKRIPRDGGVWLLEVWLDGPGENRWRGSVKLIGATSSGACYDTFGRSSAQDAARDLEEWVKTS